MTGTTQPFSAEARSLMRHADTEYSGETHPDAIAATVHSQSPLSMTATSDITLIA